MDRYLVYLEPKMAIEIIAEEWNINKNHLLSFSIGNTNIACFSMQRITGFKLISESEKLT